MTVMTAPTRMIPRANSRAEMPIPVPVRTMPSEMITSRTSRGMTPTAARPMPEE